MSIPCRSEAYAIPFSFAELSYPHALVRAADTGRMHGTGPLREVVEEMLNELQRPDEHLSCLQIAGTNGKTSTSRYTAAILRGEGKRVGLFTSPHLVRYPERIEIDGQPVSDVVFAHGVSAAVAAGDRVNAARSAVGLEPYLVTPFDVLTVAALVIFAESALEVAVLEVGLGGRWDATTATRPDAVAITGIGLDHMGILGSTLAEIAGEKAAVIRHGQAVVLGEGLGEPSVHAVIQKRCQAQGVTPIWVSHELLVAPQQLGKTLEIRVSGQFASYEVSAVKPAYQAQNIACAIMLAEAYLKRALVIASLQQSVACCPTPGRFDVLRADPLLLVDACHNPQGCAEFISSIAAIAPNRDERPHLLIAALSDKDVQGIVSILAPAFPGFAVTNTSADRALPAADLAEFLQSELESQQRFETPVEIFGSPAEAIEAYGKRGLPLVAAGTITLAGELAGLVRHAHAAYLHPDDSRPQEPESR
ncbi:bifunctional folylpolyglutamate synthase/dihydrofolate synthase [Collinsella sp. AGMB00827]|uniref:Bifunctional folylpolyglutamate synthase/dihydrofolate synthase n=1 Tax=Collinsella ureilytica TaxID=2869515 RepID=A0ABS7MKN8_9ACTN|nr:bifunctional folylpolyglutamate synthase/dihydrofolate synthase [Collinsella urealyticum]MBY4797936.1 bifunctional folylpolyglutamate synthase/dihydrofolate synthase [Collinsella urealyticum]